jgi:hypothetical protein
MLIYDRQCVWNNANCCKIPKSIAISCKEKCNFQIRIIKYMFNFMYIEKSLRYSSAYSILWNMFVNIKDKTK